MAQRVVVTGSSGLIGKALVARLRADGVQVTTVVRRPATEPDEVSWLTDGTPLDPSVLEGADAVVGLNGASVGRLPWTRRYRDELRSSRLNPTTTLASAVAKLGSDAPAFISASAVGFYGSAPRKKLDEHSPVGDTFLARLCLEWEAAARQAGDQARVVTIRTAPVMHRESTLKPMIKLTGWGLGGPIGSGTQAWPWISLIDAVRAITHVINTPLSGPVNVVGPTTATANDVGRAVADCLNRPFLVPAPKWFLTLVLGLDATDSLLTSDLDVRPAALQRSGFSFIHHTVTEAVVSGMAAP